MLNQCYGFQYFKSRRVIPGSRDSGKIERVGGVLPIFPLQNLFLVALAPKPIMASVGLGIMGMVLLGWGFVALILTPSRTPGQLCPHCGSARVRGSWLRALDRCLIWLKPFRCEACLKRFYRLKRLA